MNKVGVIGDTGMVGSEILRILANHSDVDVVYKRNSKREEGDITSCDLVFTATKDAQSMEEAPKILALEKRVIDLSGAYRIPQEVFEKWYGLKHTSPELINVAVYGLPAYNEESIREAQLVANPGCYVTSVVLAVKPLHFDTEGPLRINATSGNSGVRKDVEDISNEQTYSYGRKHKHIPEMEYHSGMQVCNFSPVVLRSVFSGINANIEAQLREEHKYSSVGDTEMRLREKISGAYSGEDLVQVVVDSTDKNWGTRDVVGTHKALIKLRVEDGTLYLTSMIDNLGKGAASQAVENMNIMLGLPRLQGISPTYRTE